MKRHYLSVSAAALAGMGALTMGDVVNFRLSAPSAQAQAALSQAAINALQRAVVNATSPAAREAAATNLLRAVLSSNLPGFQVGQQVQVLIAGNPALAGQLAVAFAAAASNPALGAIRPDFPSSLVASQMQVGISNAVQANPGLATGIASAAAASPNAAVKATVGAGLGLAFLGQNNGGNTASANQIANAVLAAEPGGTGQLAAGFQTGTFNTFNVNQAAASTGGITGGTNAAQQGEAPQQNGNPPAAQSLPGGSGSGSGSSNSNG